MGAACPRSARSVREALCDPPPNSSKLHTSARAVAASTSQARQESVPIKKATSAKKAPAKKATLKPVAAPCQERLHRAGCEEEA